MQLPTLTAAGLQHFRELRRDAVTTVTERFYAEHAATYAALGPHGREACRDDIEFHLEFLRPVLEFGLLAPFVEYLHWLGSVLATRGIPMAHVPLSLEWLADFFENRMDGADGHIVAGALRTAVAKLQEQPGRDAEREPWSPEAWPECAAFEQALLAGERSAATAIIERCIAAGRGLVDAELHIIQPALYRIGRRWQNNEISVAQEHLATAIAQSVMTLGLMKSEMPQPGGRRVLLACVEGNHHAVGLQMVADAFQLSGWEAQYLGANVPLAALVRQVSSWQPHLVGLSVSFAHQLAVVRRAIASLQETLGDRCPPVIIGGLAINRFDALATHMGAEAWSADSRSAVSTGAALVDAAT